jgi:hypothetical protein
MLPMTVLRRFDCVLLPTKAKVLAEYKRWGSKLQGEALDAKLNQAAGQHLDRLLDFTGWSPACTCLRSLALQRIRPARVLSLTAQACRALWHDCP